MGGGWREAGEAVVVASGGQPGSRVAPATPVGVEGSSGVGAGLRWLVEGLVGWQVAGGRGGGCGGECGQPESRVAPAVLWEGDDGAHGAGRGGAGFGGWLRGWLGGGAQVKGGGGGRWSSDEAA